MSHFCRVLLVILLVASFPLASSSALATRPIPLYLIASARLDAANVTPGQAVQAYCDGYLAGQGNAFAYQGLSYVALDVQGDDPDGDERDGCREGERGNRGRWPSRRRG
jgi:hypothetical protein